MQVPAIRKKKILAVFLLKAALFSSFLVSSPSTEKVNHPLYWKWRKKYRALWYKYWWLLLETMMAASA